MEESSYIHKSHNVTVLIYHLVTPAKYRRVIFNQELDDYLCKICEHIEDRYEIRFLEIGVDKDHVHFLLQSIPMYSPTKITQIIKSITSKKMFEKYPNLKEKLWGSEFWSKGYFMSTVGKHGDEQKLRNYVQNQGLGKPSYKAFQQKQLKLFG
ncbi:IS200/IS605 family transposase [Rickettsia endosymbiont of Urophora cardui]|uniref:IS200/IS605 family transposase n=1 Tax=Rickettsia endosymbiont of Urophora cardui TaxID=3066265 RepID=UPI00313BAFDC